MWSRLWAQINRYYQASGINDRLCSHIPSSQTNRKGFTHASSISLEHAFSCGSDRIIETSTLTAPPVITGEIDCYRLYLDTSGFVETVVEMTGLPSIIQEEYLFRRSVRESTRHLLYDGS